MSGSSAPTPSGGGTAERKRARKADQATRYAGDSAGALSFGVVALILAGFFIDAGRLDTLAGGGGGGFVLVGAVLGVAVLVGVWQGVNALAANLDRLLRARLRPPG